MVIFKRELKTGDTLQGSDIKDTAVAQQFGDIYDGQIAFLPGYEKTVAGASLDIGEVPIGNTYASGDYIIDAPIKRKPPFGAGILKGLDINLAAWEQEEPLAGGTGTRRRTRGRGHSC